MNPRADHLLLKNLSKQVNGTACWQIQKNKQMISIPTRTSGLKVRKVFRIYERAIATAATSINLGTIEEGFYEELGLRRPTGSKTALQFEIYGFRVYNFANTGFSHSNLVVLVFNPEEPGTAAIPSVIARYHDFSTGSGICNVSFVYAASDRPVFSSDVNNNLDILGVSANSGSVLIVDVDIGVTIMPFLQLTRDLELLKLQQRSEELVDKQVSDAADTTSAANSLHDDYWTE